MSSQNKLAWTYTDDMGRDYRRAAAGAITAQETAGNAVKVGGVAGVLTDPPFPRSSIKPRVALVRSAGGVLRRVVCYTADAPLLTAGETITLETGGADVVFTTYNTEGERKRGGITQSA